MTLPYVGQRSAFNIHLKKTSKTLSPLCFRPRFSLKIFSVLEILSVLPYKSVAAILINGRALLYHVSIPL